MNWRKSAPFPATKKKNRCAARKNLARPKPSLRHSSALRTPHSAILNVTARPVFIPDFATPRFRLTPKHFAYLKIAEGCNHPCSFCIIPRMRGSHRSRTQADIVAEAKALIADGVKEINLISQDSTYYGLDLRPESQPRRFHHRKNSPPPPSRCAADATTISTLLRELNSLEGRFLDPSALHASGALDG